MSGIAIAWGFPPPKPPILSMRSEPLQDAVRAAGSITALARKLGIAPQAISQWREVPVERVLAVEAATGVSRHSLRPDIYPPPPAPAPAVAA